MKLWRPLEFLLKIIADSRGIKKRHGEQPEKMCYRTIVYCVYECARGFVIIITAISIWKMLVVNILTGIHLCVSPRMAIYIGAKQNMMIQAICGLAIHLSGVMMELALNQSSGQYLNSKIQPTPILIFLQYTMIRY